METAASNDHLPNPKERLSDAVINVYRLTGKILAAYDAAPDMQASLSQKVSDLEAQNNQ